MNTLTPTSERLAQTAIGAYTISGIGGGGGGGSGALKPAPMREIPATVQRLTQVVHRLFELPDQFEHRLDGYLRVEPTCPVDRKRQSGGSPFADMLAMMTDHVETVCERLEGILGRLET